MSSKKKKTERWSRPTQTKTTVLRPLKYKKGRVNRYIPQGFPQSTVCKLKYIDHGTLDSDGPAATAIYSANSCFDPFQQVGGHQPLYYDTYANIYDHYVVLGSRIKATFWTENSATTYASIVGIKLDDDNTMSAGVNTIMEQPSRLVKYRFLRQQSSAGDKTIVTVVNKYSAKKFNGIKDVKDNKSSIGADIASNPAEQAYFLLFTGHPDGTTDLPEIYYQVQIDYIVQFSELRDVAAS